jgi:hypothetical protein
MEMFRQPAPQPQTAAPATPGVTQNVPQTNPDPNANPNVPVGSQTVTTKPAEKSPMADFADLWKTEAPKEGEAAQPDWNDPSSIIPQVKLDPKKIYESAQRIDFAKVMPKEKVDAALKGDSVAFNEVMNSVFHHAYANMAMSSTRIVEAMMKQQAAKLFEALPHHFRKHSVNDAVNGSDPIFSNPAVAPMLETVKDQMRVKYPTASAKEIAEKAQSYVKEFAAAVSGNKGGTGSTTTAGGKGKVVQPQDDWEDFLVPNNQQQ